MWGTRVGLLLLGLVAPWVLTAHADESPVLLSNADLQAGEALQLRFRGAEADRYAVIYGRMADGAVVGLRQGGRQRWVLLPSGEARSHFVGGSDRITVWTRSDLQRDREALIVLISREKHNMADRLAPELEHNRQTRLLYPDAYFRRLTQSRFDAPLAVVMLPYTISETPTATPGTGDVTSMHPAIDITFIGSSPERAMTILDVLAVDVDLRGQAVEFIWPQNGSDFEARYRTHTDLADIETLLRSVAVGVTNSDVSISAHRPSRTLRISIGPTPN